MSLKTIREAAGLTQQDLANAAQVNHATIARLEQEDHRYLGARYQTIVNIARVLHRKPADLFPVPPLKYNDLG